MQPELMTLNICSVLGGVINLVVVRMLSVVLQASRGVHRSGLSTYTTRNRTAEAIGSRQQRVHTLW